MNDMHTYKILYLVLKILTAKAAKSVCVWGINTR